MSTHNPFDGIYDEDAVSVHAEDASAEPEQKIVSADADDEQTEKPVDTVYSTPFLRRQSKAELQKIAKDKGLDASGGREDLIDRIEADQKS